MKKPKFKIGDWVKCNDISELKHFNRIGKILSIFIKREIGKGRNFDYWVEFNGQYVILKESKILKFPYYHKQLKIKWLRFSFYKLGQKLTIRLEISKGW